ncbi:MAG: DUF6067 family protein [Planctomycetaceae bacterium]|nr:DUF6067 family protein [Planctomycetaceae bacterium]
MFRNFLGYVFIFLIFITLCNAGQDDSLNKLCEQDISYIEISPTPVPPKIDAVLNDEAWEYAVGITGFSILGEKTYQADNQTQILITYDDENLYISFNSVLAGAKPRATIKERDSTVWSDDSIEIYLIPPHCKPGQFYQFVGNSIGTIFDQFKGNGDEKWNGNWKFSNYIWDFEWIAEISIPLADLGVDNIEAGLWRVNFCRTYSQYTNWSHHVARYSVMGKFPYMRFVSGGVINKINALEGLTYGDMKIRGSLFNPSNNEKQIDIKVSTESEMSSTKILKESIQLTPGQKKDYVIEDMLKDLSLNLQTVEVFDNDKLIYKNISPFKLQKFQSFNVVSTPDSNEVIFAIDLSRIETEQNNLNINLNVSDSQGVVKESFSLNGLSKNTKHVIHRKFSNLPLGEYTVAAEYIEPNTGKKLEIVKQSYDKIKTAEWYMTGKNLGKEKKVIPPFTPMSLKDNNIILWGREYHLGQKNDFLLKNIVTKKEEILKSAPQFKATIDGVQFVAELEDRQVNSTTPYEIKWRDKYRLGSSYVICDCTSEFDGMVKIELELYPDKAINVENLKLELPMKKQFSQLYHYSHDYYAAGHSGEIDGQGLSIDFANYIWMGNEDKGLMWFSEGPLNWNYIEKPIILSNDNFSINFINISTKVEKPIKIVFGLIATPVRPLPRDCRAYNQIYEMFRASCATAQEPLGNFPIKLNMIVGESGRANDGKFIFDPDNGSYTTPFKKNTQFIKNLVDSPGFRDRRNVFLLYFSGANPITTDFDKYESIWQREPKCVWDFKRGKNPENHKIICTCCNGTWSDFLMAGIKHLVEKTGLDGIYFDGMGGPPACTNELHGCQTREDFKGRKIAMSPIFAAREFHKRLATMLYEMNGDRAFILSHTSGCIALPILSFDNAYLDGESPGRRCAYGGPTCPELTTYGYWRAHTLGVAGGLIPVFIVYTDLAHAPRRPEVLRGYYTMMMAHGVPMYTAGAVWTDAYSTQLTKSLFRALTWVGVDSADFLGYWKNSEYIKLEPQNPNLVASFYKNGDKLMFIVSNRGKEKIEVAVHFARQKFGDLSGRIVYSVSDDYTSLVNNDNEVNVTIKPEDFIAFVILDTDTKDELIKHPSEYYNPQGNSIILQDKPVTIDSEKTIIKKFYVQLCQTKMYLSAEARTKIRDAKDSNLAPPPEKGFEWGIFYKVNGKLLTSPESVVNIEDCLDLIVPSGEAWPAIISVGAWMSPYSPDFNTIPENIPVELRKDPYKMVFDISSFIKPGAENTIEISGYGATRPREIRNVKILFEYKQKPLAKDTSIRDIPVVKNPIVTRQDFNQTFTAKLTENGGIIVNVNKDEYKIDSKFSYPQGDFNRLSTDSADLGEWKVDIAADGQSLIAKGATYNLNRKLINYPDRVEVLDTLSNLTNKIIGIRLGHSIIESADNLQKTYMTGLRLPDKVGQSREMDFMTSWNPTIYISKKNTGIGLLVRDKVFRTHLSIRMKDKDFGIHDKYFGLGVKDSYTLKWAIYPTQQPDYYGFINTARRTVGVNYLIDGSVIMASSLYAGNMNNITDEEIINLIKCNGTKYVVLNTTLRLDEKGNRIDNADKYGACSFGPAFFADYNYWTRYYLEKVAIPRFKKVVPGVKCLPYIWPWSDSQPNAMQLYPDDQAITSEGANAYLVKPQKNISSGVAGFIPTMNNKFGAELQKQFDYNLINADGIYLDGSSLYQRAFLSYNDNQWDGHSCIIDLGTGGWDEKDATYKFRRKVTSPTLASLEYRCYQIKLAKEKGTQVWCNFCPSTEEFTQTQAYHFTEPRNLNNVCWAHLSTPCGLICEYWGQKPEDSGKAAYYALSYGGLPIIHGVRARYTDCKNGNIFQDIYPIKPLELHPGYVIGENKIITTVSGEYGFRDKGEKCTMTIRFYDCGGYMKTPKSDFSFRKDTNLGWLVKANIDQSKKEMAIIFR